MKGAGAGIQQGGREAPGDSGPLSMSNQASWRAMASVPLPRHCARDRHTTGTGMWAHLLGVGRVRQRNREATFRDIKRALHTRLLGPSSDTQLSLALGWLTNKMGPHPRGRREKCVEVLSLVAG